MGVRADYYVLRCDCEGCPSILLSPSIDLAERRHWLVIIDQCVCPRCNELGRLPPDLLDAEQQEATPCSF